MDFLVILYSKIQRYVSKTITIYNIKYDKCLETYIKELQYVSQLHKTQITKALAIYRMFWECLASQVV